MDADAEKLARKAWKLAHKDKLSNREIGERLKVSTEEAKRLALVGGALAANDGYRLTDAELLLIRSVAAAERALLAQRNNRTPKGWEVGLHAGKAPGWCAATARRRVFDRRFDQKTRRDITGLGFVHQSPNGHVWLTPAGWALVMAAEAAARGDMRS